MLGMRRLGNANEDQLSIKEKSKAKKRETYQPCYHKPLGPADGVVPR